MGCDLAIEWQVRASSTPLHEYGSCVIKLAIVTNSIDPLVIMLATVSIGAIYSSTGTDMGVTGMPYLCATSLFDRVLH
jgi:hypothetical protein